MARRKTGRVRRVTRHLRVRRRVSGSAARPRLCVFRSLNHVYAQVVDDAKGVTLAAASSLDPEIREQRDGKPKSQISTLVGKHLLRYQGWFGCPGDGSELAKWIHWSRGVAPSPETVTFDLWPDTQEIPVADRCETSLTMPDGSAAPDSSLSMPDGPLRANCQSAPSCWNSV